jgi:CDP-diacylglycerol--glycerol-3-phosphate 3-phosphatidyltransferase
MVMNLAGNQKILEGLRRQLIWYALVAIGFYGVSFAIIRRGWGSENASRWLVVALCVFGYSLWFIWSNLKENRRTGETGLLLDLGAGNLVSISRGILIGFLYGLIFIPKPSGWLAWVPGMLYSAAALTDIADGALARLTNHATRLGEVLDMYLDGLGMLAATALLAQYETVPRWYVLIGLARYLFLSGMWLRERLGKKNFPLPPSVRRRWMGAVQMGFVSIMLFPLFSPPVVIVVADVFGFSLLVSFLWDWLYVSGVVNPEMVRSFSGISSFVASWIPIGIRLVILVASLPVLVSSRNPDPYFWTSWVVLVLIVTGTAGRSAALLGLLLLGLFQLSKPLTPSQLFLGILYALILLLGSGVFSLWQPENGLIYKKIGEKPLPKL